MYPNNTMAYYNNDLTLNIETMYLRGQYKTLTCFASGLTDQQSLSQKLE
jgi:hypothetical protein